MVMCPLFITTVSDNLFNVKKKPTLIGLHILY